MTGYLARVFGVIRQIGQFIPVGCTIYDLHVFQVLALLTFIAFSGTVNATYVSF